MKVDDLSDPDTNTLISSAVQHAGFGTSKDIKWRSASERYRTNGPIAEVFCHATEREEKTLFKENLRQGNVLQAEFLNCSYFIITSCYFILLLAEPNQMIAPA